MGAEGLTHGQVLARYVGAFVDSLVAAGVEHVCLCPGSRSTPLALVIARHPGLKVWTHLDERSCAFFALGMAKALRRPVAVVCSSGTAAVNFAPAVTEARYGNVPLIVLTADRPQELRGVGATQTIDQVHLFGSSVKADVEMLLPETAPEALRYARFAAARAVAAALDGAPGPVHVNFPFREPLVPDAQELEAVRDTAAAVVPTVAPRRPTAEDLAPVAEEIAAAQRGVIIVGPQDDAALAPAITALAAQLGWPVIADVLSQVRNGPHLNENVIAAFDTFLRHPATVQALAPDYILRFGATVVSKPLATYLQRYRDVPQAVVTPDIVWSDPDLTARRVILADPTSTAESLLAGVSESPSPQAGRRQGEGSPVLTSLSPQAGRGTEGEGSPWLSLWREAERTALSSLAMSLTASDALTEPAAAYELALSLPEDATVFAGNSMPVRDLDTFVPPSSASRRFLANRGASGIDGVVSSALGAAAVSKGRVVLLIGDISFYHDMNGLLAARRHNLDATIVLLNNDGGGIFSFLPQNEDQEHFEALFGTPHGLDFRPAMALYGLDYTLAESRSAYREALKSSFARPGVSVIEVRTDRRENVALHQQIWRDAGAALSERGVK